MSPKYGETSPAHSEIISAVKCLPLVKEYQSQWCVYAQPLVYHLFLKKLADASWSLQSIIFNHRKMYWALCSKIMKISIHIPENVWEIQSRQRCALGDGKLNNIETKSYTSWSLELLYMFLESCNYCPLGRHFSRICSYWHRWCSPHPPWTVVHNPHVPSADACGCCIARMLR